MKYVLVESTFMVLPNLFQIIQGHTGEGYLPVLCCPIPVLLERIMSPSEGHLYRGTDKITPGLNQDLNEIATLCKRNNAFWNSVAIPLRPQYVKCVKNQ